MMATDIIDMLENIGRSATPRLSPAVRLTGDTAEARRASILNLIRGTVLPRRLEFNAQNGTILAIEVNSSRITDVYSASTGALPDFETEPREALIEKLARLVSDLAATTPPIEVVSLKPDGPLEADDVGITFSEMQKACSKIVLPSEPRVSVVPDPVEDTKEQDSAESAELSVAAAFFDGAERFAMGRLLTSAEGATHQFDGLCADGQPLHPSDDLLTRFAQDLAGWDADNAGQLEQPQLIVMRPSGGKGAGVALVRDGRNTAAAVHDARKLGAVVNLWKSLRESV